MGGPLWDLSTAPNNNAACWKYQAQRNRECLDNLRKENEALKSEIRRLKEDLYGKKSERSNGGSEGASTPRVPRPKEHRKGARSRGRLLHTDLPAEPEVIDLPESDRVCPVKCSPLSRQKIDQNKVMVGEKFFGEKRS